MAKLEEEIVFDSHAFLLHGELPVCQVKDCFVANTSKNAVSAMQISTKKLLQTWTLKQPHIFTCPVVYNTRDDTLCAVYDQKVLISWEYSSDSLKDAPKVMFHDAIFSIIMAKENIQVVVFTSGTCLLFNDALSKYHLPTEKVLENDEQIIWAKCAMKSHNVLVYMLCRSKKITYKLYTVLLEKDLGTVINSTCNTVSRDSKTLISWCLGDGKHSFIAAWSDGEIYSYSGDKPAEHVLSVSTTQNEDLVAVEAMDSSHLAVIRLGSFDAKYIVLEVWDTKFGIKKMQNIIEASFSKYLQVKVIDSSLFLSSDQDIISVPFQLSFTNLAYVVGKCPDNEDVREDRIFSWESNGTLKEVDDKEVHNFSQLSHQDAFNKIVSKLMEKDTETISDYVIALEGISESKLVMLLRIFLRMRKSPIKQNGMILIKGFDGISEFYIGKHIVALFCVPFTCAFIQVHLRMMKFQEILETLEILFFLMDAWKSQELIPTDFESYWPTDDKIVLWIEQLMKSHTKNFLENKEVVSKYTDLIKGLHESILERIQVYDSLNENISSIMFHQKMKCIDIEKPIADSYSIEILYI